METAMMRAQPPRKVVNALPLLKASLSLMTLPSGGGEGTQLFFGGCVLRGFQNVGWRERIFLKNGGLGNENFEKFRSRELEFWPKHG